MVFSLILTVHIPSSPPPFSPTQPFLSLFPSTPHHTMKPAASYYTWPTSFYGSSSRQRRPATDDASQAVAVALATAALRSGSPPNALSPQGDSQLRRLVTDNALVVFSRRGCCMSHVIKLLFQGLGVNPTFHEFDESEEAFLPRELSKMAGLFEGSGVQIQLPAVFVGGRFLGGLDRVMATHISGELVPILKEAKALWL